MRASSTSADEEGRGGRWVVAQVALMGLVVGAGLLPPGWPEGLRVPLAALGAALAFVGAAAVVWAWRALGRAASPFPLPSRGGRLVETGPYEYLRHPIYAAALLFFAGYGLATSPAVAVPLIALALLWRNKAALEEDLLAERYPEYVDYRRRVRGGFVPTPPRPED